MDYQEPKLFISYRHLDADTPKKLEELMLTVQVRSKRPVDFTPPTFNNKKWHTWFMFDFAQDMKSSEKLKVQNGTADTKNR